LIVDQFFFTYYDIKSYFHNDIGSRGRFLLNKYIEELVFEDLLMKDKVIKKSEKIINTLEAFKNAKSFRNRVFS